MVIYRDVRSGVREGSVLPLEPPPQPSLQYLKQTSSLQPIMQFQHFKKEQKKKEECADRDSNPGHHLSCQVTWEGGILPLDYRRGDQQVVSVQVSYRSPLFPQFVSLSRMRTVVDIRLVIEIGFDSFLPRLFEMSLCVVTPFYFVPVSSAFFDKWTFLRPSRCKATCRSHIPTYLDAEGDL